MAADPVTVTEIRPDEAALRLSRRSRALAEMEAADVDVLIVGREGNARYVSGAPRLWTAGSRAFGPGCVIVRATGAVHLLSTWDEGVPDDIPHENLYGITFNTTNFVKVLENIDGAATARTVATDGMTPGFARLLPMAFPSAQLVDGEDLMRRARRVKTAEEIDAIRASVHVAERALATAEAALVPGISGRQLTGVFMEAMATAGVTTPATQDVAWITSPRQLSPRSDRDAPVGPRDLVAFDAGVISGGYVGEVGRTYAVEGDAAAGRLFTRWDELWDRLLTACRPGAPATDLLDAYDATGVPPPPMPVARGLGLGFDLPLVTHALPRTAANQQLERGMVVALTAYVWKEDVGAVYGQEPVVVTESRPVVLSANPFRDARSPMT
ncbi:MAG TPA: M24 family metallopeptidase [Acidimicrobiales bacterium]|jgi:Xaa-Pro aminopeptidase|nr:M24 family metallopeptidase [Acidimicrobiales bacterium]